MYAQERLGRGWRFAPPPHDDDELLFKSRVLLLFKIPIPKLLHARACIKRKDVVFDDDLLLFVCCVCVVPSRRYIVIMVNTRGRSRRVPPFYPQSHYDGGV